jgi:glucan 1,3-beta-glucosidase
MGPSYTAAQISLFPTLTQTGTPVTLPVPSAKATGLGDGWFNKQDTKGAWTTVNGCQYDGGTCTYRFVFWGLE